MTLPDETPQGAAGADGSRRDGAGVAGRAADVAGRVAAIIVNYNAAGYALGCVESLRAAGVVRIRVCDNGSTDGSVAQLRAAEPDLDIVETSRNLGYGGGANRGAEGIPAEFLLISNADIVLDPKAVELLVAAMDAEPDVGILGARLENTDGSLYPSGRTFPDMADAIGHAALGLVRPSNPFTRRYRMLDWDHTTAADVDWVSGACFLIRGRLFRGLGGFDESYFMYLEDVDLCWRAWRAGWRVRYLPDAAALHIQGVSTDQTPYRMLVAHHRSMLRFAARTTRGSKRAMLPVLAVGVGGRLAVAVAHRALAGGRSRLRPAVPTAEGGAKAAGAAASGDKGGHVAGTRPTAGVGRSGAGRSGAG